jgi:YhcH/YjgK/YiaL family protein
VILDSLDQSDQYSLIHPLFKSAFEYLKAFRPSTPDGRQEIFADRMFSLPQTYQTVPASEKQFEAHRRYIDIQYILSGEEMIEHAHVGLLRPASEFDVEKDVRFFNDPTTSSPIVLRAGDFAVFFPHDAHKPCLSVSKPVTVRKVVVKVAVSD